MKTDNFFAIHELMEIGSVDVKTGIATNGQDRYYFYLNLFLDASKTIFTTFNSRSIDTEFDLMAEKFENYRIVIEKIQAVQLLEYTVSLLKQLGDHRFDVAKETFNQLAAGVEELYNRVIKTIIYKSPDGKVFKTDEPALKIKIIKAKKAKKNELTTETLAKILKFIQDFQLLEAKSEVEGLSQIMYTYQINMLLEDLKNNIGKFDTSAAAANIKSLLPLVKPSEAVEETASGKPVILAVDDNVGVLNTIKAMLKGKYEVFCIPDPKVVFRFLLSHDVDLILLDIEMPDLDGYEVLQRIRKMIKHAATPVIFLTGNTSRERIEKALQYSANDFIGKPVDLGTLLKKIEKHRKKK